MFRPISRISLNFVLALLLSWLLLGVPFSPVFAQQNELEGLSFIKKLRLARAGDDIAQLSVATDYEMGGNGARKDAVQAARWYREAALQGNMDAQFKLSKLLLTGAPGLPADVEGAMKLLHSAGDLGYAAAQNDLGLRYQKGDGVLPDINKAVSWYRKAADQKFATAEVNLGLLYVRGDGVAQDYATAFKLFSRAAETGDAWALNNLGSLYEMGWGTNKDLVKARQLFEQSAAKGNAMAAANLARLATKLSQ